MRTNGSSPVTFVPGSVQQEQEGPVMGSNRHRNLGWTLLALVCAIGGTERAWADGPLTSYCDYQSSVSFIDSALPMTQYRVKFDSANNLTRPNRAEFFWPATGVNGRPLPERNVDYQELRNYFEIACHDRLSFFVEMPVRFLDPEINDYTIGAGDINAGMKLTVLQTECSVVTGQMRVYANTGIGERGLGTDRLVLEPGILFNQRLHEWITLEGEVKYVMPMQGSALAGDVLRYGLGVTLFKQKNCGLWATPTAEFFGWVPVNGQEQYLTANNTVVTQDVSGKNVISGLWGGRVGFGDYFDVYGGYGVRLDGDAWFDEIWRLEVRFKF